MEMEKFIEPALLKDNAEQVEKIDYVMNLSNDELANAKDLYTDNAIKLAKLEDSLKEIKADFKEKIRPVKEDNLILLSEIKTGVRELFGEVYLMADQINKTMGYYSSDGHFIKQRPLQESERQLRIDKAVNQ